MRLHVEKRDGTEGGIKGENGQWLCRKSDTSNRGGCRSAAGPLPDLGQDELP